MNTLGPDKQAMMAFANKCNVMFSIYIFFYSSLPNQLSLVQASENKTYKDFMPKVAQDGPNNLNIKHKAAE